MNNIIITEREMTSSEYQRMKIGFDENATANGVKVQSADRFTLVATTGSTFTGCTSGLAYINGDRYSGWFYLTDLFVEKEYRFQNLGSRLLKSMEEKIIKVGVNRIYTWTAGYEAPKFYQKLGYKIFAEMEHWYSEGYSRIGLRKNLY